MKILIIGSNGMLGKDLIKELSGCSLNFHGLGKLDLDILDPNETENKIFKFKPSVVVLAAAYTFVDNCEDQQELANAINGDGARNVALSCKKI